MFGYGRAQNVAGLIAATLFISFTSYKLYEEAIPRLIRSEEASYQSLGLAVAILVLSMLIAAAPLVTWARDRPCRAPHRGRSSAPRRRGPPGSPRRSTGGSTKAHMPATASSGSIRRSRMEARRRPTWVGSP